MQLQLLQTVADQRLRPGQETRAYAIGDIAEAEVEARRLDLIGIDALRHDDVPVLKEGANIARRKYPVCLLLGHASER